MSSNGVDRLRGLLEAQSSVVDRLQALAREFYDSDYDGKKFGIRFDKPGIKVGSLLQPSYVWVDGKRTSKKRSGTSAVFWKDLTARDIDAYSWGGRVPYVVSGDMAEDPYELDRGEIVLKNCVVLAAPEGT